MATGTVPISHCKQNMEYRYKVISCQLAQLELCHCSWSKSLALTKIPLMQHALRRPWDAGGGNFMFCIHGGVRMCVVLVK